MDFPWHILLIDGHVVGCPKVAADGTVISCTGSRICIEKPLPVGVLVLLTGRDHGFSFPEHLELPDYRMLHVIF